MEAFENQLVGRMARSAAQRFVALCDNVELKPSERLWTKGIASAHVYFPLSGSISLMSDNAGASNLEIDMVGREGMLGIHTILGGVLAPARADVLQPGRAYRIAVDDFNAELSRSPALQVVLQRYLYLRMLQMTSTAVCARFHEIGPRLARWMLMSHDRAASDSFEITHEALSQLLGVRRAGITRAAGQLQQTGCISYRRGVVQILDRPGLERASCACYQLDRQTFTG